MERKLQPAPIPEGKIPTGYEDVEPEIITAPLFPRRNPESTGRSGDQNPDIPYLLAIGVPLTVVTIALGVITADWWAKSPTVKVEPTPIARTVNQSPAALPTIVVSASPEASRLARLAFSPVVEDVVTRPDVITWGKPLKSSGTNFWMADFRGNVNGSVNSQPGEKIRVFAGTNQPVETNLHWYGNFDPIEIQGMVGFAQAPFLETAEFKRDPVGYFLNRCYQVWGIYRPVDRPNKTAFIGIKVPEQQKEPIIQFNLEKSPYVLDWIPGASYNIIKA